MLLALCSRSFSVGRTIVFFRTKHQAHRVKMLFGLASLPPAAELHGNMTQAARLESLDRFRQVLSLTELLRICSAACFLCLRASDMVDDQHPRLHLAGVLLVFNLSCGNAAGLSFRRASLAVWTCSQSLLLWASNSVLLMTIRCSSTTVRGSPHRQSTAVAANLHGYNPHLYL